MKTLTSVCLPKEHSSMMDEDYPGLLLGLFYEQSLTDNTWTQHSEETHIHIISHCYTKSCCKTVNFPYKVQQMHCTHIPLLKISQSLGRLQA